MKYIIDVEEIKGTDLYRAKGFSTLVFDSYGLSLLTPFNANPGIVDGALFRTKNGSVIYEFKGITKDGYHINAINKTTDKFVCLKSKIEDLIIIGEGKED